MDESPHALLYLMLFEDEDQDEEDIVPMSIMVGRQ
jgi:hypothetical protein